MCETCVKTSEPLITVIRFLSKYLIKDYKQQAKKVYSIFIDDKEKHNKRFRKL